MARRMYLGRPIPKSILNLSTVFVAILLGIELIKYSAGSFLSLPRDNLRRPGTIFPNFLNSYLTRASLTSIVYYGL